VGEQLPLYLAKNNGGDPSAIAEFSTGDTIPSGNMASSISATDIFALTGTFTELTSTSVNVSSNTGINCQAVSSIALSSSVGTDTTPMILPAPIIWLRMDTDGSTHISERSFGHGSTVIGVSSIPNLWQWDNTNDVVYASAIGYYKIQADCLLTTAATQTVTLNLYVNDVIVHQVTTESHALTDPHWVGLTYVGLVRKGQSIKISRTGDGSNALTMKANSTLTIERVG
jgi:hypothetical protein